MDLNKFEIYITFLESMLSEARLKHSIGVMQVMGELAEEYQLNRQQACIAGLLHDAAKEFSPEEWIAYVNKENIKINSEQDNNYLHYLHGPVSAVLIKEQLDIEDPLILGAISTHTYYGDNSFFNHPLTWCLRFSDILEPTRDWQSVRWLRDGLPILRKVVYEGKMDLAAYLQTGWLIDWFSETGKPVHPNMVLVFEKLSEKLNLLHEDLYRKW